MLLTEVRRGKRFQKRAGDGEMERYRVRMGKRGRWEEKERYWRGGKEWRKRER